MIAADGEQKAARALKVKRHLFVLLSLEENYSTIHPLRETFACPPQEDFLEKIINPCYRRHLTCPPQRDHILWKKMIRPLILLGKIYPIYPLILVHRRRLM